MSLPISEDDLQIAVVDYCRARKGGREKVMHIANQGSDRRYAGRRVKLARMGLVSGASDLFFPCPLAYQHGGVMTVRCGFWLELKAKGKRPTDEQLSFLEGKAADGYCTGWADNYEDAVAMIDAYFTPGDGDLVSSDAKQQSTPDMRVMLERFVPMGKPS